MPDERKHDIPAIVMGMDPTGLAVVRALGREGVPVWGIDGTAAAAGFFSRYCRRLCNLPSSPETDEKLLSALLDFAGKHPEKPVIFATGDEYVQFLGRYDEILRDKFRYPAVSEQTAALFLNKRLFYDMCLREGIPTPTTFYPRSEAELAEAVEAVRFPAIIKPIYTHIWARELGLRKVFRFDEPSQLVEKYIQLRHMWDNLMVQELIPGDDSRIYFFGAYFDRSGRPHGAYTGRKLRQYPPLFGTTTLAEPVDAPRVAELAIRLLTAAGFHGLCDAEFKLDERDGEYKVMEVNPRVGRWYSLGDAHGACPVYKAYCDLIGEEIPPEGPRRYGFKWALLSRDVFAAIGYIRQGRMTPGEWIRSVRGPKEHAVWAADDPLVLPAYALEMICKLIKPGSGH